MSGTAKPDKPKARSGMSATGPMRSAAWVSVSRPWHCLRQMERMLQLRWGRADLAVNLSGALGGSVAGLTMAATSYGVLNAMAATLAAIVLAAVLRVGRAATRSPVSSRIAPAVPCGDAAAGAGVCPG